MRKIIVDIIDGNVHYYCGFKRLKKFDVTGIEWDTDIRYAKIMSQSEAKQELLKIHNYSKKYFARIENYPIFT